MLDVLIRKCGLSIDIGLRDGTAFPPAVLDAICGVLVYDYREFLRGHERYRPDGTVQNIRIETRRLYEIFQNRIVTGFGMTPAVVGVLQSFGYSIDFEDLDTYRERTRCYEVEQTCFDSYTWRPGQRECFNAIFNAPGGIISAPPAFGKSEIIARMVMAYPHAKFAISTRRKEVAKTIYNRMLAYTSDVGFVGDSKNYKKRATVYIAKSLHKADPDVDFFVGDEIHELAADTFSETIIRTFDKARFFGFSASWDGRADGTSARLQYMFGPTIFNMSWQEATKLGLIVPIEVQWLNISMNRNPCQKYTQDIARKRHGLWRNAVRNEAIANAVREYSADDQVLILVETIEHAIMLKQYLPEFELCYGEMELHDLVTYKVNGLLPDDYEAITGEDRERLRTAFEQKHIKKVIATDVWSTGVSFEQLAVLVRADGRSSEILDDQAPGRVARTHLASGKEKGVVIDCYDMFDTSFKRKSDERMRRYRSKGWTQFRPKVSGST